MGLKENIVSRSLWVFHAACSPCNNCDIEILDVLTPRHDAERLGVTLVGSVRHADVLLVTGVPNYKTKERLAKLYSQISKPCFVAAIGSCACGRNLFRDSYNSPCPVDDIVPVDVYIPGCPPKPEAIIAGLAKLINKVRAKK